MNFPQKPAKKKLVYLDHAATTYIDERVKKEMDSFFTERFANPSSVYGIGRDANGEVNNARRKVAEILHALPDTIIFTSGGTESDNLAILGTARKHEKNGNHIITSVIEHHAVLHTCQALEKLGFVVTYLKPDEFGYISPKQISEALTEKTILVSLMYGNNEIGTVNPIADIGREILKWRKEHATPYPYFHTDACQAAGALDLDVEKLHVDLMTLNGGKIYGPKGAGILYKGRNINIEPLLYGGFQEMHVRAGTENVPGIVGFTKALELIQENKEKENKRLIELRNYFWNRIQEEIPKVRLNGPKLGEDLGRLPNNLNISILDIEGEALLLYLDEYGIVCSTGSACTSQSLDPSHVLLGIGLPYEYAHGSLRFTLGHVTTKDDIDYVVKYLPSIVSQLREISPVNLKYDPEQSNHPKYHQR